VNIFGVGAPVTRNGNGTVTAYVSVGSIMHDNCCYANGPDAIWCQPHENPASARGVSDNTREGLCRAEWDKAVDNLRNGRQWRTYFGPYAAEGAEDLTPAATRS